MTIFGLIESRHVLPRNSVPHRHRLPFLAAGPRARRRSSRWAPAMRSATPSGPIPAGTTMSAMASRRWTICTPPSPSSRRAPAALWLPLQGFRRFQILRARRGRFAHSISRSAPAMAPPRSSSSPRPISPAPLAGCERSRSPSPARCAWRWMASKQPSPPTPPPASSASPAAPAAVCRPHRRFRIRHARALRHRRTCHQPRQLQRRRDPIHPDRRNFDLKKAHHGVAEAASSSVLSPTKGGSTSFFLRASAKSAQTSVSDMKTLSAALAVPSRDGRHHLVLVLEDRPAATASIQGFTDHDRRARVRRRRPTTPSPASPPARCSRSSNLAVDNLTVLGALSSATPQRRPIWRAGLYDDAAIEIWRVNWADTSQRVLMRKGALGQVTRGKTAFQAEMRGLAHVLNQPVGRAYGYGCDADLGDARCTVDLADPAYSGAGSVASVIDARRFTVSGLSAFADGWFANGKLAWTSGANAGRAMEIKRHGVSGTTVTPRIVAGDERSHRAGRQLHADRRLRQAVSRPARRNSPTPRTSAATPTCPATTRSPPIRRPPSRSTEAAAMETRRADDVGGQERHGMAFAQ